MAINILRRRVRGMSAALAHIETEGREIIQRVTQRESAKIISLRTGITPRHVYNLRDGECQPRWMHFIALAQQYPELRGAVARWLSFDYPNSVSADAALDQIRRIVAALPDEGDQQT